MANTFKWVAGEAAAQALTTGLNSLATGNTALSAEIDNTSGLYELIDLEVYLGSITTGVGAWISVWVIYAVDGSNYEDGTAGTPGVVPTKAPDAVFSLKDSTTSTWRRSCVNVPIAPLKFKLLLQNNSGATLASSGNILTYSRHYEQVV